MLQDDDNTLGPLAVDARDFGGRIGFFVETTLGNDVSSARSSWRDENLRGRLQRT